MTHGEAYDYGQASLELRRIAARNSGVHAAFFRELADEVDRRFEALTGCRVGVLKDSTAPDAESTASESEALQAAAASDKTAASTDTAGANVAPPMAPAVSRAFRRSEALHRMGDLIERVVDAYAASGSQRNERARKFISEARRLANRWSEHAQYLTHARGKLDAARTVLVQR